MANKFILTLINILSSLSPNPKSQVLSPKGFSNPKSQVLSLKGLDFG